MTEQIERRVNKALIQPEGSKLFDTDALTSGDPYDRIEALRVERALEHAGVASSGDTSYDRIEELRVLRLDEVHSHDVDPGDTTDVHPI